MEEEEEEDEKEDEEDLFKEGERETMRGKGFLGKSF